MKTFRVSDGYHEDEIQAFDQYDAIMEFVDRHGLAGNEADYVSAVEVQL